MKTMQWLGRLLVCWFLAHAAQAAEEPGRIEGVIGSANGPVSNAWVFIYSAGPREGAGFCVRRAIRIASRRRARMRRGNFSSSRSTRN
jgi:hypothetical protein